MSSRNGRLSRTAGIAMSPTMSTAIVILKAALVRSSTICRGFPEISSSPPTPSTEYPASSMADRKSLDIGYVSRVLDGGALGREVYAGGLHSVNLTQRTLDVTDARGAGHPAMFSETFVASPGELGRLSARIAMGLLVTSCPKGSRVLGVRPARPLLALP